MNRPALVFIFSCILLFSCGTTKNIFGGRVKDMSVEEIDMQIKERTVVFNTFSGKAKVDISGKDISQSVSASIDIRKDSVIGISLRVMGVEGARIEITPDSIKILDRLNQQYIPRDFSFLATQFALNTNFSDLQNLLTGNPVYYDHSVLTKGVSDDKYVLFAQKDVYKNTIWLSPGFDILRMFIEDLQSKRTLTLTFDDYQKIQGRSFAFIRTLLIDAENDLSANIEFTKVTFDEPFAFSFTVNPKYERVD